MAFILNNAENVGQCVDACADFLLGGLFREKTDVVRRGNSQRDIDIRNAQRRAVQLFREHLNEVYCGDADTLLKDVPVPFKLALPTVTETDD